MAIYSPLKIFFDVASPKTLRSIIRDIDDISTGADIEQQELKAMAKVALANLVGEDEMELMTSR